MRRQKLNGDAALGRQGPVLQTMPEPLEQPMLRPCRELTVWGMITSPGTLVFRDIRDCARLYEKSIASICAFESVAKGLDCFRCRLRVAIYSLHVRFELSNGLQFSPCL